MVKHTSKTHIIPSSPGQRLRSQHHHQSQEVHCEVENPKCGNNDNHSFRIAAVAVAESANPNANYSDEKKKRKSHNAFHVLMQQSPEKRQKMELASSGGSPKSKRGRSEANNNIRSIRDIGSGGGGGSRFVTCPICNSKVPQVGINLHLDRCVAVVDGYGSGDGSDNLKGDAQIGTEDFIGISSSKILANDDRCEQEHHSEVDNEGTENSVKRITSTARSERQNTTNASLSNNGTKITKANTRNNKNAFSCMMGRSRQLSLPPIRQRFHLCSDHSVSWSDSIESQTTSGSSNGQQGDDVLWSATMKIESDGKKALDGRGSGAAGHKRRPDVASLESLLKGGGEGMDEERDLELVVTSSIPAKGPLVSNRLVRRHSRLSVPVLKSILQKSIRRRRALPAVRVAMELADKSWGDLVRRLSIIILEDSTLHPDLPFFVWLMVAHSKNFDPPLSILARTMRAVYEIASCPWRDPLTADTTSRCCSTTTSAILVLQSSLLTFPYVLQNQLKGLSPNCSLMIKTMLLRVKYGGMKCDMVMLVKYAELWLQRFRADIDDDDGKDLNNTSIPLKKTDADADFGDSPSNSSEGVCLAKTAHVTNKHTSTTTTFSSSSSCTTDVLPQSPLPPPPRCLNTTAWMEVSHAIHAKAKEQSKTLIEANITPSPRGGLLDALELKDLSLAGVDFHCSSILEDVVANTTVFSAARQILLANNDDTATTKTQNNTNSQSSMRYDREWVVNKLKASMWKYSSGINLKRKFIDSDKYDREQQQQQQQDDDDDVTNEDKATKQVWDDVISPKVNAFAQRFLSSRLAV